MNSPRETLTHLSRTLTLASCAPQAQPNEAPSVRRLTSLNLFWGVPKPLQQSLSGSKHDAEIGARHWSLMARGKTPDRFLLWSSQIEIKHHAAETGSALIGN